MSNALRRKKKPEFYTKREVKIIGRNDFEQRNADRVVTKSYKDFVAIGYIVLRDLFGFGQKRIIRLQKEMKARLETAADGGTNGAQDIKTERIKVSYLEIIVTMIGKSHITKSSTRKSERTITTLVTVRIS